MWEGDSINIIDAIGPLGGHQDRPWLMDGDDNIKYAVKFRRNDIPTIMNEIFANKLASKLHLPVPEMILVNIDQQIIDGTLDLKKRMIPSGRHIATAYIENTFTSNHKLEMKQVQGNKIINLDQVPKFIVFDTMLYNADRNETNTMLSKNKDGTYQYHLIDHGMIFEGRKWNNSINNLSYRKSPKHWNMDKAQKLEDYEDFIRCVNELKPFDYWDSINHVVDEFLLHENSPKIVVSKLCSDDQVKIINLVKTIIKGR